MKDTAYLLKMIKDDQKNEEAFTELLKQFKPMIYKIIYSKQLDQGDYRIDEDDLFQEGSLALYHAATTFEEGRNVRFSSYAYMVIRSRISEVLRNLYRSKENQAVSLDGAVDYSLSFAVKQDPALYHREERFRKELESFMESLSSEDQKIFELKSMDMTYGQIGEKLNIPAKKVDNRLRVLRKMLKDYLDRIGAFVL